MWLQKRLDGQLGFELVDCGDRQHRLGQLDVHGELQQLDHHRKQQLQRLEQLQRLGQLRLQREQHLELQRLEQLQLGKQLGIVQRLERLERSAACTTAGRGPLRGSAIALTADGASSWSSTATPAASPSSQSTTPPGSPRSPQVRSSRRRRALAGGRRRCDTTAYVVLRKDQKVVAITDLIDAPAVARASPSAPSPRAWRSPPTTPALRLQLGGRDLSVIDPSP